MRSNDFGETDEKYKHMEAVSSLLDLFLGSWSSSQGETIWFCL